MKMEGRFYLCLEETFMTKKNFYNLFYSFRYFLSRMIITLNEYTFALLCGGVSCITYILLHFNDIKENDLTSKSKKKVKEETSEDSIISSSETCNMSRRQSQLAARFRAKRAESIKNEHVIFADEFNDDDEKYTPNTAIHDSEVCNLGNATIAEIVLEIRFLKVSFLTQI